MSDEPIIERKLVARLGRAAADNALELAEEADLLDENGHSARAFALTVLAAEELGKAFICSMTEAHTSDDLSDATDDLGDWESFGAMVVGHRKHETKLLAALFLMQQVLELADQPPSKLAEELSDLVAGDLHLAKMRALYADIEGGDVVTPAVIAEHEGAQQRARALRREIVGWAIPLSLEPLENDEA